MDSLESFIEQEMKRSNSIYFTAVCNQKKEQNEGEKKSKMQYIVSLFPYFLNNLCPRPLLLSYIQKLLYVVQSISTALQMLGNFKKLLPIKE